MPGKLSKDPSTGTRLMKPTATGKNPLWKTEMGRDQTVLIQDTKDKTIRFLGVWDDLNEPEQEEESIDLQNDSDDRPANQNHKHSSQEEAGGFHFVPLEEESERPLQANDEWQACDKQNLRGKHKQTFI